jgi:putative phosphoribosyl transferase
MTSYSKNRKIPVDGITLEGILTVPGNSTGLVLFSHGSGSSRLSPRNNFIARELQRMGIATLLFDLLTAEEDEVYSQRFNIKLLSERLVKVTQWTEGLSEVNTLPVGYFGASTGAASALTAAAQLPDLIKAVVSRGGRPDLAFELNHVKAPTLLIVGENDPEVMRLNEEARTQMTCPCTLCEVKGATHLFEEPGALEEVASLAGDWFIRYLNNQETSVSAKKTRMY